MKTKLVARMAAGLSLVVVLGSCAATPENCQFGNKAGTGALIGGAAGLALGGIGAAAGRSHGGAGLAIAGGAMLVGAAIGAVAGHMQDKACHEMAVKRALDQAFALDMAMREREQAQRARSKSSTASAAPRRPAGTQSRPAAYQPVNWGSNASSSTGLVVPIGPIASDRPDAPVCYSYNDTQLVSGVPQTVTVKSCQLANGEWKAAT